MDAKLLCHIYYACDDVLPLLIEIPEEAHINLQHIEIEVMQRVERRILRAEVIEPDLVACLPEAHYRLLQLAAALRYGSLGDLDMDVSLRDIILPDCLFDSLERIHKREIEP